MRSVVPLFLNKRRCDVMNYLLDYLIGLLIFLNKDAMIGRSTCGNGIVDEGEQCDCGPVSFECLSSL